jgi:hypothetical protein
VALGLRTICAGSHVPFSMTDRTHPADAEELRKRLCDELAQQSATPEGRARLHQLLKSALRPTPCSAEPGAGASPTTGTPAVSSSGAAPHLSGASPAPAAPDAAARGTSPPAGRTTDRPFATLTHRIAFLGESVAAGMFHAPHLTPAQILSRLLNDDPPSKRFELLDLARPALTDRELVDSAAAALRQQPSLLVAFAGNNWVWSGFGPDLSRQAAGDLEECEAAAAALATRGVPGLRALAERRQLEKAGRTLDDLAALARAAGVPLLWVVPEVNLPDIDVPHPVYWLAGDGVRSWYRGLEHTRRRLAQGDPAAAARGAERLLALDGGACAESHGLLARAYHDLGRTEDAFAAWRAQADATSWDLCFRRASGVNTTVLGALRDGCRRHAIPYVDLPQVFAEAAAPAAPGRCLFLDHCHLTVDGMILAMAALAPAVRRALEPAGATSLTWRDLLPKAHVEVPATVLGLARFQAALYNANLNYRHWPRIDELLAAALAASPLLRDAARDYLLARGAPCGARLAAACRRNQGSPVALDSHVWERGDLGGGILERLLALLERHRPAAARDIVATWIAHDPLPGDGRELAAPRHRPLHGMEWDDDEAQVPLLVRALAPASTFRFIADARGDLELACTARLPTTAGVPRGGAVTVSVNGRRLGSFRLAPTWRCYTTTVDRHLLARGLNTVRLAWPMPSAAGDAALAAAAERLRRGIAADLYPVFGEVFSLRVAAPASIPVRGRPAAGRRARAAAPAPLHALPESPR